MSELIERDIAEFDAELFADHFTAGENGQILERCFAPVAKARRLDRDGRDVAADLIHDECRECFTVDVIRDDQYGPCRLCDLFQHGEQVADGRDLGSDQQHVCVLEHPFHAFRVAHEVRRDVALVEAHAFDHVHLDTEALTVLDSDDAILADLVDGVADHLSDLFVRGRDGGHLRDLFAGEDLFGLVGDRGHRRLDGGLDALLQQHRIRAGADIAEAFMDHGPCEHGRRRRAVSRDVVGLLRDFLEEFGADSFEGIMQLDRFGDGDAVVGDRRRTP